MTLNNDEVICPNCVHQFRAIPQNVQQLMLDAGFGPPFTTPPAQRTRVWLTDEEIFQILCIHVNESDAWWSEIKKVRAIEAKLKEKNT